MKERPSEDAPTPNTSNLIVNESLERSIAEGLSFAYERGVLDGLDMKDGEDKTQIIKTLGLLKAPRWIGAARTFINMGRG